MIIKSYKDFAMTNDPVLLKPLFERRHKSVSLDIADYINKQTIKNYAVIFSGHQPLLHTETYIEYKHLENSGMLFEHPTKFVDKNHPVLLKLLSKLKTSTLVFIYSPEFSYLSLDKILSLIDYYKTHTQKQIIVVVSIFNICFNRLGTDIESLEQYLNGKFIDNSIVICS
jgi:hypothetical protein